MKQVRIHGRGGQGSVTFAGLIARAAFEEGYYAQAFPSYGVERRGAPVEAFVRVDDAEITDRSQVQHPDAVIVQDSSLLEYVDVTSGLVSGGRILVNTEEDPASLGIEADADIMTVDATDIALEHLGRPIMNTALLGAFANVTDVLSQESVEAVIMDEWPGEIGEMNVDASAAAFEEVQA